MKSKMYVTYAKKKFYLDENDESDNDENESNENENDKNEK